MEDMDNCDDVCFEANQGCHGSEQKQLNRSATLAIFLHQHLLGSVCHKEGGGGWTQRVPLPPPRAYEHTALRRVMEDDLRLRRFAAACRPHMSAPAQRIKSPS